MARTTQRRKPKPRPGAAKFGVDLDKKIGASSDKLADALIEQFKKGNPTAMNIVAAWAQDAEFAQKCEQVHGKSLLQLLQQMEDERRQAEEQENGAPGEKSGQADGPQLAASSPDACSTEPAARAA